MLGLIFTELIEMVEDRFSAETADAMLSGVPTNHGGAYTAVGYYPHEDLVALVVRLSSLTNVKVEDLVRAFGGHLVRRFSHLYPNMFGRHATFLEFVAAIDGEIHVEVHKLYPQAMLPRFDVLERSNDHMKLLYSSPRHLEPLVVGALEALASYYRVSCRIEQQSWSDGRAQGTLFNLTLQAA